jgi:hypothetical protein
MTSAGPSEQGRWSLDRGRSSRSPTPPAASCRARSTFAAATARAGSSDSDSPLRYDVIGDEQLARDIIDSLPALAVL